MLVYIASCRLLYRAIICRLFVSWVLNNFPRDFIKGVQWSNYKVECVSCATSTLYVIIRHQIFPPDQSFHPAQCHQFNLSPLIFNNLSPLLLSPTHHAQHRPTRFTHCRRRPLASLLLWMGCLFTS